MAPALAPSHARAWRGHGGCRSDAGTARWGWRTLAPPANEAGVGVGCAAGGGSSGGGASSLLRSHHTRHNWRPLASALPFLTFQQQHQAHTLEATLDAAAARAAREGTTAWGRQRSSGGGRRRRSIEGAPTPTVHARANSLQHPAGGQRGALAPSPMSNLRAFRTNSASVLHRWARGGGGGGGAGAQIAAIERWRRERQRATPLPLHQHTPCGTSLPTLCAAAATPSSNTAAAARATEGARRAPLAQPMAWQ